MGEQGAKSLRGGKMEDVIFAGTSARAAAGPGRGPPHHRQLRRRAARSTTPRSRSRGRCSATAGPTTRSTATPAGSSTSRSCSATPASAARCTSSSARASSTRSCTPRPEERRGFIEEAAGVLKHRKRKEKALRKLDATEGNLTRLSDLLGEIRRQLKPLGRQAEVARRASAVQTEVRDARARLLADDVVHMRGRRCSRSWPTRSRCAPARRDRESPVGCHPRARDRARGPASRSDAPRLAAGAGDLVRAVGSPRAAARHRTPGRRAASAMPATSRRRTRRAATPTSSRPRQRGCKTHEAEIAGEVEAHQTRSRRRSSTAHAAEAAHPEEDRRIAGLVRAAADRREGLARLAGQVNAIKSRAQRPPRRSAGLSDARDRGCRTGRQGSARLHGSGDHDRRARRG